MTKSHRIISGLGQSGGWGYKRVVHYLNEGDYIIQMKEKPRLEMEKLRKGRRDHHSKGTAPTWSCQCSLPHPTSPWTPVTMILLQVPSHWNISKCFSHAYSWYFFSFFLKCPALLYTHKCYLLSFSSINIPLEFSEIFVSLPWNIELTTPSLASPFSTVPIYTPKKTPVIFYY